MARHEYIPKDHIKTSSEIASLKWVIISWVCSRLDFELDTWSQIPQDG